MELQRTERLTVGLKAFVSFLILVSYAFTVVLIASNMDGGLVIIILGFAGLFIGELFVNMFFSNIKILFNKQTLGMEKAEGEKEETQAQYVTNVTKTKHFVTPKPAPDFAEDEELKPKKKLFCGNCEHRKFQHVWIEKGVKTTGECKAEKCNCMQYVPEKEE
jgi:hypothetical protein